ncbi:hypothetical protein TIFTF001_031097 [Ficus carica]|uniref:Uncharacterized protein n=1 Tax=Ficus carica TaxID=3494 RepID=A0AA88DVT1_FICCA|nr:hypothetical protein TIFTF001_031097 [Ficus carica]
MGDKVPAQNYLGDFCSVIRSTQRVEDDGWEKVQFFTQHSKQNYVYCAPAPCPSAASVPSFTGHLPISYVLLQWRSPFFLSVFWVFESNIFDSLRPPAPTVCSIFPIVEFLYRKFATPPDLFNGFMYEVSPVADAASTGVCEANSN